jgi:23S rRNA pseudouridine2605 synthase
MIQRYLPTITTASYSMMKSVRMRRNNTIKTISNPKPSTKAERLSKYISSSGICSRREAEIFMREGRVQVNGVVNTNVCESIDLTSHPKAVVMLDGVVVQRKTFLQPPKLWAIYKYRGELTSTNDEKNRNLLLVRFQQLMKNYPSAEPVEKASSSWIESLKPVNRLDYNTEGLCLISNNGVLSRSLANGEKLKRQYRIRVHGLLSVSKLEGLRRGVFMEGKRQKAMEVEIEKSSSTISWIKVTTTEPSNRTVYDSLRQVHLDVTRMISTAVGPITLKDLPEGRGVAEVKLSPEIMKEFLNEYKKG